MHAPGPLLDSRHIAMGKGVSAAEKRERLVAMFHASGEVYSLKCVEKAAPRAGVAGNVVKDVLKQVCDDDLVREGKVGVSTYYWAFPGEAAAKKRAELGGLAVEAAKQQRLLEDLRQQSEAIDSAAAASGGEAAEVAALEASVRALREREAAAQAETERLRKSGAQDLRKRKADVGVLRDAANRWTDNLFELKKRLVDDHGMDGKELDKMLGTDRIDFVE